MYLCHSIYTCRDLKGSYTLFTWCIERLHEIFKTFMEKKTIIVNISREPDKVESSKVPDYELGCELEKQIVLDETVFEGRKRNEYFYNSKEFPTLKDAQGKIVILTNWELTYWDKIKYSKYGKYTLGIPTRVPTENA